MIFVIEKLIESKVSPKAILNIIELGAEHEKQAQFKRDFIFNQNTIAHLAHKAGIKIGYDFDIEKLREKLLQNVYGQENAVEMIVTSVGMAKYGIRNKSKPVLTALFVGPTGVGKTELSIALSNIMFGEDTIIRLDMGEYTERHSVSRLVGSPPGYVGYSTDTAFSAALKKNSRRVILFDEIEKAAPEVHQLLLSLLDTGKVTLANGETIDTKDSIIIMTSNALVDKLKKVDIGFNEEKEKSKILSNYRKALEENKIFTPEFLNRIDAVIPFNFLNEEVCTKIIRREVEKMTSSLEMQGYKITIPEDVTKLILKTTNKPFNGRSIVRSVDAIKRLVVMKIIKDKENNNIVVTEEDVRRNSY
jgi:ATP-dependent Clp protease ATP-binding subunit ClpA